MSVGSGVHTPDRVIHATAWVLVFLIAGAAWFGREWFMVMVWSVASWWLS